MSDHTDKAQPSLVVYGYRYHHQAAQIIREQKQPPTVYEADWMLPKELASLAGTIHHNHSLLDSRDFSDLHDFVWQLYRHWSRAGDEDLSLWQGIPLYKALNREFIIQLNLLLGNMLICRRLFERYQPAHLYMGQAMGLMREVWEYEADSRDTPCTFMEPDPVPIADQDEVLRLLSGRVYGFKTKADLGDKLQPVSAAIKHKCSGLLNLKQYLHPRPRGRILLPFSKDKSTKIFRKLGFEADLASLPPDVFCFSDSPEILAAYEAAQVPPGLDQEFARRHEAWLKSAGDNPALKFRDMRFAPLLHGLMDQVFNQYFPQYAEWIIRAQAALNKAKPDLMLIHLAWIEEYECWALAAQKLGIPVVTMQKEPLNIDALEPAINADYALTYGERTTEYLTEKEGFDGQNIIPVGIWSRKSLDAKAEKPMPSARSAHKNKLRIVYLDTHHTAADAFCCPPNSFRNLYHYFEAAQALPQHDFLLKFHPNQLSGSAQFHDFFGRKIKRIVNDLPPNLYFIKRGMPIYQCFELVDVVVSEYSFGNIEAMAFNLPVIYLQPFEYMFNIPNYLEPMPAAYQTLGAKELIKRIETIAVDYAGTVAALRPGQLAYWRAMNSPLRSPSQALRGVLDQAG